MTDRIAHANILWRLYKDPRSIELLTNWHTQMAVLAAHALAKRGCFSRHKLDVPRVRRRTW